MRNHFLLRPVGNYHFCYKALDVAVSSDVNRVRHPVGVPRSGAGSLHAARRRCMALRQSNQLLPKRGARPGTRRMLPRIGRWLWHANRKFDAPLQHARRQATLAPASTVFTRPQAGHTGENCRQNRQRSGQAVFTYAFGEIFVIKAGQNSRKITFCERLCVKYLFK